MAHYLVTGGAGFIGSHLCEELTRRDQRVRVADSLVTGKRTNLGSPAVGRVPPGRSRRRRVRAARGAGRRLRAAPGGAAIGAALGQGSDYVEPRQRRRDVERARRGARRRGQAARLRGILVGLRQHGDAAQARGDAEQPAVAVRAAESRGRAVPADVHHALQARDGDDPLLQRLRPAPGSVVALFGRDLAVRDGAAREPRADDLRRRRADARLHLRRQRRGRRPAGVRGAGRGRQGHQRRDGHARVAQPAVRGDAAADWRRRHAGVRAEPRPATCRTRRPTSDAPARSSATSRSCRSRKA